MSTAQLNYIEVTNEPNAKHSSNKSRQASARGGYCGVCRGGQSDYAVAVY